MIKKCNFIEKLRETGLRPTKQRIKICEILFSREKTFHFTINDLVKTISNDLSEKIALATVYNTVHAFKNKGYLKEISINSDKNYFDTNTSAHHHFYDEDTQELIDCDENDVDSININKNITGKKINSIEVLIRVASDNHNQN
jgi:Fur family transcriptional regulator, iron response regulator